MNQIEAAQRGIITSEMDFVAEQEAVPSEFIRKGVANGKMVLIYDRKDRFTPVCIGPGLKIKINANIGTSCDHCDPELEIRKAKEAERWGTDTIMDLSTEGNIRKTRLQIINNVKIPVGAVPVYQAASEAIDRSGTLESMTEQDIFKAISEAAQDGCSMLTVHCGLNKENFDRMSSCRRIMKTTSRGGGILASWMRANNTENPLFQRFDDLLDIARQNDIILSLGASLRSGCISDGGDDIHKAELTVLGKLVKKARKAGVQIKVEGPGHLAAHKIGAFIKKAKKLCKGAPLGVLGPIVTDIAPGYDYITLAIGATIALLNGADYICTVYPSEHLGLPTLEEIPMGIISARIAAHAVDIARNNSEISWDNRMAKARAKLDWPNQFREAIDPHTAKSIKGRISSKETCSVCGNLCPYKLFSDN